MVNKAYQQFIHSAQSNWQDLVLKTYSILFLDLAEASSGGNHSLETARVDRHFPASCCQSYTTLITIIRKIDVTL